MEAIGAALGAAWPVPLRNDLATSFYNRALARMQAGTGRAARADVDACLAIQQPLVAALGQHCPLLDAARRLRATMPP
jgi:hypothetical protein